MRRSANAIAVRTKSLLPALALAALSVGLSACGGGSGPTAPSRMVVTQQNWTAAFGDVLNLDVAITGSGTGTVDVTVNWTSASNDIDIAATSNSCSPSGFLADSCNLLASAQSTTAKPERISFQVTGGSVYRIWIVNFGPGAEAGTVEVGLTR